MRGSPRYLYGRRMFHYAPTMRPRMEAAKAAAPPRASGRSMTMIPASEWLPRVAASGRAPQKGGRREQWWSPQGWSPRACGRIERVRCERMLVASGWSLRAVVGACHNPHRDHDHTKPETCTRLSSTELNTAYAPLPHPQPDACNCS